MRSCGPPDPHQKSYFVSGKLGGRQVHCLLDTGCTTNILSKRSFDRLPSRIKETLEAKKSHGAMADETTLPFYGAIKLDLRLNGLHLEEIFVVGRVSEDVLLGMPFLAKHQCTMTFDFPTLSTAGKQVPCIDRHGWQLTSDVQAVRTVLIPPKTERIVLARITLLKHSPMGLVERMAQNTPGFKFTQTKPLRTDMVMSRGN